jgi:hypothetical protein
MVSVQLKRSAKPKIYLKQDWKAIAMAVPSDEVWGKIANEMRSADGLHRIKGRAYITRTGNVQAMECTGFRRYGCTYELKVVEDSANETWSVYEGEEPHCHDAFSESTAGIPQHYKTTIEKEVASGKYPRDIYEEILLHSPKTIVQMKQVQGAVHRLRKKLLCEFPDDSIGYLQQFLKSNTLSNASEEHDVGVLPGWHVSDAGSCLEKSNKAANLHFTLTTKALLRQAVSQNEGQLCSFVDIDGTYNLVSNGYPCLILGTVDAKHCFRLLGFTVSMHEDEAAFASALQAVKAAMDTFLGCTWSPSYAMADSKLPSVTFTCTTPLYKISPGLPLKHILKSFLEIQSSSLGSLQKSSSLQRSNFSKQSGSARRKF